jgi:hypothetical protein
MVIVARHADIAPDDTRSTEGIRSLLAPFRMDDLATRQPGGFVFPQCGNGNACESSATKEATLHGQIASSTHSLVRLPACELFWT